MSNDKKAHADFSPSALSRILACPGSFYLHESTGTSPAAARGTALHDMAEKMLIGIKLGVSLPQTEENIRQYLLKNDLDLREDGIQALIETFQNILAMDKIGGKGFSEKRVELVEYHPFHSFIFGTADYVHDDAPNSLLILDWKFGRIEVSPYKNPQLMAYAWLYLNSSERLINLQSEMKSMPVELVIVQPGPGISTAKTTGGRLISFGNILCSTITRVLRMTDISEHLNAGAAQCKYCSAAGDCPALAKTVAPTLRNMINNVGNLSDETLMKIVAKKPAILSWLTSVEDRLIDRVDAAGGRIGEYTLVNKIGRAKPKDVKKFADFCKMHLGGIGVFEPKLRAISTLRNMMRKQAPDKIHEFEQMLARPIGDQKLKIDDPAEKFEQ